MSGSNGRRRNDAILSPDIAVTTGSEPRTCVGVLALQGDFREHRFALGCLGAATCEVRRPYDLKDVDGLVVPGGESTTIGRLMAEYGLVDAVREFALGGRPVFGTCAGLITLARDTVEGYRQPLLRLIDIVARRNAFGRQVRSFEVDLAVPILGETPLRAVFIRAPWIEHAGPGVAVLAECQGYGVAAQEGNVLVTAFHPELTGDLRVHEHFLTMVERARAAEAPDGVADASTRMSEEVVS